MDPAASYLAALVIVVMVGRSYDYDQMENDAFEEVRVRPPAIDLSFSFLFRINREMNFPPKT
jgi:hypothetical protein